MRIANDQLAEFIGTTGYYKYLSGNLLTDGVNALAEQFHCYWFLDIICSYSKLLTEYDFQVWELIKYSDDSAKVVCMDGNKLPLIDQSIPWTDFPFDKAIVWKEGNVLLLPSEH